MIIARNRYLNQLKKKMWNGRIKVITGLRRCGKSYLLFELFKDYLIRSGVRENHILSLSLDDDQNEEYRDPRMISSFVRSVAIDPSERYYVLLDEIQFAITKEEMKQKDSPVRLYSVLNGFLKMKNVDVYVTGSNSKMLSRDISTEFRGRGDVIHMYPLSFSEFYSAAGLPKEDAYSEYIMFGGMPYILSLEDEEDKYRYLSDLFSEIYFKDMIERYDIALPAVLSELTDVLCSSVGSLTNANKIANTLHSVRNARIASETVANYISYLTDCFLFSEAKRYDVKGKKYFEYPSKYYCADLGLRNARLNFRQQEETHLMENMIYNELLIRGYTVDVGVVSLLDRDEAGKRHQRNHEIDFIASKGMKKYYIQSAYSLDDEQKASQEKRPLLGVKDVFRKIIISGNRMKPWTDELGILRIGILDFLLNEDCFSD